MNERNLYRGLNNFEGSIGENGNLYDERHSLVGRIEGNDIYDNSNIKQGSIDANGKLWDCNRNYVGEAHGNNFIGPAYQSTGMVRGDSFGEGDGCEYGALMMLKKRSEQYSGNMPDTNYNFPNNDDGEEEDEEEIENEYGYDDGETGDDEWNDFALEHEKAARTCIPKNEEDRSLTRSQGSVRPRPQSSDSSYVPPDSYFSTGRKNEYRLNGLTYVDVSGKSIFWTSVLSLLAGLNGKAILTDWDRMNGTWDRMKQEAARNR